MSKVFFHTKTFDRFLQDHNPDFQVTHAAHEAELLVLGSKGIDFSGFPKLRAVYRFGIGTDNIDFDYLGQKNLPIYFPDDHVKNILFEATANFTVYGILNLFYQDAFGDVKAWKKHERDFLGNKKALVIGLGNIGGRVAQKLKTFMPVTGFDIAHNNFGDLQNLLREADIISIHIPLTPESKNFFDREKLALVKNTAILANTARGALFDEEALYEKLRHSDCRAYFDVFWQEPYSGKLKDLGPKKFLMTPHSASNTKEFLEAGFQQILGIARDLKK